MTDLKLFFINLDRAEDRAGYMWSCLKDLGLAGCTERVSALDASRDRIRNGFERRFSSLCYALDQTEIACWESHRKAWQRMLDLDLEQAVFLEDDLVFAPGFKEVLSELVAHVADYDLIKLDGIRMLQRLGPDQSCGSLRLRCLHHVSYSSAAYLLSKVGAKRLLRESESYNLEVDMEVFAPRKGWRMFQLFPAICLQGMFLHEADREGLPEFVTVGQRMKDPGHKEAGEIEPWWFTTKRILQVRLFHRIPNKLWRRRAFLHSGGSIERVPLKDGFARYNKVS